MLVEKSEMAGEALQDTNEMVQKALNHAEELIRAKQQESNQKGIHMNMLHTYSRQQERRNFVHPSGWISGLGLSICDNLKYHPQPILLAHVACHQLLKTDLFFLYGILLKIQRPPL